MPPSHTYQFGLILIGQVYATLIELQLRLRNLLIFDHKREFYDLREHIFFKLLNLKSYLLISFLNL